MASNPAFTSTPNVQSTSLSGAITVYTGVGSTVIFTAGDKGAKVQRITISATASTTASMLRLFYKDGSNYSMIKEIPTETVTLSGGSVEAFRTQVVFDPSFIVGASDSLTITSHNADTFHITVEGMNF